MKRYVPLENALPNNIGPKRMELHREDPLVVYSPEKIEFGLSAGRPKRFSTPAFGEKKQEIRRN